MYCVVLIVCCGGVVYSDGVDFDDLFDYLFDDLFDYLFDNLGWSVFMGL